MAKNEFKKVVKNKLKGAYGETDLKKKVISINKKLHKSKRHKRIVKVKNGNESLLNTEVHEIMHAKHPGMSEKTTRIKAKTKAKKMTKSQKSKTYSQFK